MTKLEISSLSILKVTLLRLNSEMDSLHGKLTFDGNGGIKVFLAKVEIQSSSKGYTEEKCAQALAGRLEGPAFDLYLRMYSEDRKDAAKIKSELLKEFERGKRNREEALDQLGKRSRQEGESAQNYAYMHNRPVNMQQDSKFDWQKSTNMLQYNSTSLANKCRNNTTKTFVFIVIMRKYGCVPSILRPEKTRSYPSAGMDRGL